jgi:hypothetical protein
LNVRASKKIDNMLNVSRAGIERGRLPLYLSGGALPFGQIPDPPEAVYHYYCDEALEDLVAFKAEEHRPGRGL